MYSGEDFNFCFAYMLTSETIDICYKQIYIFDVSDLGSLSRKCRLDLEIQLKWEIREAAKTVKKIRLTEKNKKALLIILDYFMARNVFSCIAETFKKQAPSYWKNRKNYQKICAAFNNRVCSSNRY